MSSVRHYSWSAVGRFGTIAIGLLGNIFVARILTPDDYGLVAMLAILMGLSRNIINSGFGDCLIRKKDADAKDFATVWSYNVFSAVVVYILFYFSATWIAAFFQREELVTISRVLPMALLFGAIAQTENIRLARELDFKRITLIQLLSGSLSFVLAYMLALKGFSYWAVVAQIISQPFFNLVFNVVLNRWKPFFFFSIARYRSMRSFGVDLLLSNLTNILGEQTYSVIIGKHYSAILLGYFNQGSRINTNLFQGLNAILLQTSYPLLAKEEVKEVRSEKYKQILSHFSFAHLAMSIAVIVSASSIVEVVFGSKWISMTGYLQLILLSYLFTPLTTINANSIKIDGKSRLFRNLTFFRNGILVVAALSTFFISMYAVLVSMVVARYISIVVDTYFCADSLGMSQKKQFSIVLHQLISPAVGASGAFFVSSLFHTVFMKLIVFLICYLVLLFVVNRLIKNPVQQYYFDKLKRIFAHN